MKVLFRIAIRRSPVAAAALLATCQSAWAQGCVMCYTSASALNGGAARSLDKAIIVLFIPPALIFLGIGVFIYRRRKSWHDKADPTEPGLHVHQDGAFHPASTGHHSN